MVALGPPQRRVTTPFVVVVALVAAFPVLQLLLNAIGYSIPQGGIADPDQLPVVVDALNQDVTRVQFWGFVVIVAFLLPLTLWLTPSEMEPDQLSRSMSVGLLAGAVTLIYPLFRVEQWFLVGGAIAVICSWFFSALHLRWLKTVSYAFGVALAVVLVIVVRFVWPVLGINPVRGTTNGFSNVSTHYFLTLMNGHDLVCCGGEFGLVNAPYGYLMVLVFAPLFLIFRVVAATDQPVVVLFATQIVVLGFIIVGLRRIAPSKWRIGLLMVVLVAPFVTFATPTSAPNLSAIRYLPIVIAVVAMSRHLRSAPSYGGHLRLLAIGSSLFALAPDTGFVAMVGLVTFVSIATTDPLSRWILTTRIALRLGISVCVGAVFYILLTALLLRSRGSNPGIDFVRSFSDGFSSLAVRWTPLPSLILLLLTPLMVSALIALSRVEFRLDGAFISSLAVMGVLWTVTFQNRMTNLNVWFLPVLIVLAYLRILESRSDSPMAPWSTGLIPRTLLIFAFGGQALFPLLNATSTALGSEVDDCVQVDAVIDRRCVDRVDASHVSVHLSFPRRIVDPHEWLVCSPLSSEILLLGLNDWGPLRICSFATQTELDDAREYLLKSDTRYIAVPNEDDPVRESAPVFDWSVTELMRELPGYEASEQIDGWIVYERVP